jgi:hypothetical protein
MLRLTNGRFVKFFPQVQWSHRYTPSTTPFARLTDEPGSVSTGSSFDVVADLRKRLDFRLWQSLAAKDWVKWEQIVDQYKEEELPLDEVSFSLVVHGYLMSHHHPSSMAILVLDEMKRQNIHPAIIELNEKLVDSFFELSEMGIKSSLNGWQNIARLAWMSAARLRKKRSKRVREFLKSLPTEEVLQLTVDDVGKLVDGEHEIAKIISQGEGPDEEEEENLLDH